MRLGLGLQLTRPGGGGAAAATFDSVSFFAGTAGGFWDLSDFTTLFQDTAGSTSVSANNDPIGRINDKSGNSNNILQGTAGLRPLYKTNAGLPYALFDGVDDWLRAMFAMGTTWERISAIQIVSFPAAGVNEQYFGGVTANEAIYGNASNLLTMFNGSGNVAQLSPAPSITTDYVLSEIWAAGNSCAIRLDNGSFSATGSGAVNPGGITIGASSSNADAANMRLSACLMINRSLTTLERSQVVTYLASRQGRVL